MSSASRRSAGSIAAAVFLVLALLATAGLPPRSARADGLPDHLVVSEVVTGGTSASDELIEIYNPTPVALPLEGLELVYVTASGATISRRAAWDLGAPSLGPGRHLLVANELGVYAAIADAVYASGMAATGGSVALRIQGASSAVDAVGWGTAASTWLEGRPAPAPAAGSSIERLPGGASGSTTDSDDNLADFTAREVPEPQNVGSAPVPDPGVTPAPPTPTPTTQPTPTPTPNADTTPIASARALPDGTAVTIEGVALSASDFTEGGGFVADATGGIAVLATGAGFERGDVLRLGGTVDDRFSQRTLRVDAADLAILGAGSDPAPLLSDTGAVGEVVEGSLVRVSGDIVGGPSQLSTGLAFDLDDGSGPTRLVVATATGIDASSWDAGTRLELVGVAGQRDSTGSGTGGYRVHPRDAADIVSVGPAPTATPHPSVSGSPAPTASAAPPAGVITIAAARELPKNATARVRGTVTMAPGVVDPSTAVIQDATGAIVLRLGVEVAAVSLGEGLQVDGVRSTKSGMETLRVSAPPIRLGVADQPTPRELKTGDAGEHHEATLVVVRGALVAAARRSSSGGVSFELDDGSGPLRVSIGAAVGAKPGSLPSGTWFQVTGILGQDTTGAQPLRGYRVWPRAVADLRVLATSTGAGAGGAGGQGVGAAASAGDPAAGLDAVGGPAGDSVRIGATVVAVEWPELGIGGLLWDGERLVALDASAALAVEGLLNGGRPPLSVELRGLRPAGTQGDLGLPLVAIGDQPDSMLVGASAPAPPSTVLPVDGQPPRWVAVVGRLAGQGANSRLLLPAGESIRLDLRCASGRAPALPIVGVRGVATAEPRRIVVPCGEIRAAPSLGRPAALMPAAETPAARLAGLAGRAAQRRAAPIGAAALLGLAALGLLGGGLAARRQREDDPPPDPRDGSGVDEAERLPSPPALTLVPLPRDRAP